MKIRIGQFMFEILYVHSLLCYKDLMVEVDSKIYTQQRSLAKLLELVNSVTKMVTGCLRMTKVSIFVVCK